MHDEKPHEVRLTCIMFLSNKFCRLNFLKVLSKRHVPPALYFEFDILFLHELGQKKVPNSKQSWVSKSHVTPALYFEHDILFLHELGQIRKAPNSN